MPAVASARRLGSRADFTVNITRERLRLKCVHECVRSPSMRGCECAGTHTPPHPPGTSPPAATGPVRRVHSAPLREEARVLSPRAFGMPLEVALSEKEMAGLIDLLAARRSESHTSVPYLRNCTVETLVTPHATSPPKVVRSVSRVLRSPARRQRTLSEGAGRWLRRAAPLGHVPQRAVDLSERQPHHHLPPAGETLAGAVPQHGVVIA